MMPQLTRDIRVMLVVVHRIILSGLQRLIDDEKPHLSVVATASSGSTAVDIAVTIKPDVVVLDVDLLEGTEDQLVPQLSQASDARVLILADDKTRKIYEAAILRGACGVVDKSEPAETLIKAIKKVHEGQLWLDRSTTGKLFVELSKQKIKTVPDPVERMMAALTIREQEVVRVLATDPGADNKKLANSLHIGEHTLRNHLSRIYDKLGVPNRMELYLFVQRQGMRDIGKRPLSLGKPAAMTDLARTRGLPASVPHVTPGKPN
jgi:two-component system nitrate/nitrite response regulator NarL